LIRKLRAYPATTSATICLLVLTSLFWLSGALWPSVLPDHATSRREVIGMSLMLILMPTYFVITGFVLQRRSIDLIDQIRMLLPDPRYAHEARERIRGALTKRIGIGLILGGAMGLSNANLYYAFFESSTRSIDITTALAQLALWTMIGIVLCQRLVVARCFGRLGEVIRFELFQLERLKLFARSGLNDVLLIAGAVALSPLQSLDAEFRWYNYSFALMVAFPAAVTLVILPMWHLHRRIADEKAKQLGGVEDRIAAAYGDEASKDLRRFEALLAHRDRLRDQSTWPFSTAFVSRFVAYLVIPPIAWAGAALVEQVVTNWLD